MDNDSITGKARVTAVRDTRGKASKIVNSSIYYCKKGKASKMGNSSKRAKASKMGNSSKRGKASKI